MGFFFYGRFLKTQVAKGASYLNIDARRFSLQQFYRARKFNCRPPNYFFEKIWEIWEFFSEKYGRNMGDFGIFMAKFGKNMGNMGDFQQFFSYFFHIFNHQ